MVTGETSPGTSQKKTKCVNLWKNTGASSLTGCDFPKEEFEFVFVLFSSSFFFSFFQHDDVRSFLLARIV